jgi:hypothetical protein
LFGVFKLEYLRFQFNELLMLLLLEGVSLQLLLKGHVLLEQVRILPCEISILFYEISIPVGEISNPLLEVLVVGLEMIVELLQLAYVFREEFIAVVEHCV